MALDEQTLRLALSALDAAANRRHREAVSLRENNRLDDATDAAILWGDTMLAAKRVRDELRRVEQAAVVPKPEFPQPRLVKDFGGWW